AGGSRVDEALVLDLASAALACGASLPGALQALGEALEEDELAVVGRALLLGADWDEAWDAPDSLSDTEWRAHSGWDGRCDPNPYDEEDER
uniref:hypothetical protein n=1 Tax=uncultured Brevundimonas sp. TaxID=213418 RepID=UPI0025DFEAEA